MKQGCHFINGQWTLSDGPPLTSINPMNGDVIWKGNEATSTTINAAYNSAKTAFQTFSKRDFLERAGYLETFRTVIQNNEKKLSHLISLETGKPMWEAKTEVQSVIGKINLAIQAYQERTPNLLIEQLDNKAGFIHYRAHGVLVVIGAYNFPIHLANAQIIPALLAGNTILYKPSELTPLVNECYMKCWEASGLPKGVIACLQGGATVGQALIHLPIQGVLFTGSYATGKSIHATFAGRPEILLVLEMGGNNPLIIDDPMHLEGALYHTILSAFITAGQRCTSARRLFIKNSKNGDYFLKSLIKTTKALKIGAFHNSPEPFMGPLIHNQHADHCLKIWQDYLKLGGKALLPLKRRLENIPLLEPGLIDMTGIPDIPDDEVFGPLLKIYRYDDFEEALILANQTNYGLVSGLISDDKAHFERFYEHMRTGLIQWNLPTTGASGRLPFGGIGKSGNYRPGGYFSADYAAYPIASVQSPGVFLPEKCVPGISFKMLSS